MPLGNRVKTDELFNTYDSEAYLLGTLYTQLADEVNGIDLKDANGADVFAVATPASGNLQAGERVWMFVKATEAITAGDLCDIPDVTKQHEIARADAAGVSKITVAGVAQFDIASGKYGWIVVRGTVVAQAATGVTAGGLVQSTTTDGEIAVLTISAVADVPKVLGFTLETAAAGNRYGANFAQAKFAFV